MVLKTQVDHNPGRKYPVECDLLQWWLVPHQEDVPVNEDLVVQVLYGKVEVYSNGTCQTLVLSVGDVKASAGVAVLLGQAKVDEVELVAMATYAHQEVVRLDVPVDEVLAVQVLYAPNHLV